MELLSRGKRLPLLAAVRVDAWWSKTDRLWIVQAMDPHNNQVGPADYAANRRILQPVIDAMKRQHGIK